jgi:hypothetical protein
MCEIVFNKEVHDKHFIKTHLSRMNMVLKTKQDQIQGMTSKSRACYLIP